MDGIAEQQDIILNKQVGGPFDEATAFIETITKRLSSMRQRLGTHADKIFGESPTGKGDEKTSPMPISNAYGGKLIELVQSLVRLESEVGFLDEQVVRNCQL